jgi:hypothetical protein
MTKRIGTWLLVGATVLAPMAAVAQQRPRVVLERDTSRSIDERLAETKTMHVTSEAGASFANDVEAQLVSNSGFRKLGIRLTRDPEAADLVVEVGPAEKGRDATLVYTIFDRKSQTVIAGGKRTALFGLTAKFVAREIVRKIEKARADR